jgi:hypothetical protein
MSRKVDGYIPNTKDLTEMAKAAIKKGVNDGLFGTDVQEPLATREKAGCEKVIKGKNNAYIVLGRDRPTSIVSGGGGAGYTQCGMIDMVVGLNALVNTKRIKKAAAGAAAGGAAGKDQIVSPSFASDAARIYMSQRCMGKGGIDAYLGLTRTRGPSAENKSGIGIKADHVRIVGRESVRIYAARGQNFKGFGIGGEPTTLGTPISKNTIELIAGREEDLQPAVLGNNLKEYLEERDFAMTEVIRTVINMIINLIDLNITAFMMNPNLMSHLGQNINDLFTMVIVSLNAEIDKINSLGKLIIEGGNPLLSNTVFIT